MQVAALNPIIGVGNIFELKNSHLKLNNPFETLFAYTNQSFMLTISNILVLDGKVVRLLIRMFLFQSECFIYNNFVSNPMKDNPFYVRKNIRMKTALHSSNANLTHTQLNQSRKTLSVKKQHAKSIKSFKKIAFESKVEGDERYSTNLLLSHSRIALKNSKKVLPTHFKKNEIRNKFADRVTSVNLPHLRLSTKSWCMFDQKERKYFGFRQDHRREIASLTKIMTTILSIEIMNKLTISPKTIVKITQSACGCIGTTANLKKDCWISLQNLLYGAMLPSGNDAAFTLAEYLGYCVSYSKKKEVKIGYFSYQERMDLSKESTTLYALEFIHQMNALARKIGLIETTFSNPHGLMNAMNISTAKDILKLSIYACKNNLFKKIVNSKEHFYEIQEEGQGRKFLKKWENTNKLLGKGWEGVKTGMTASAGSCLSSLREGVFIVVLNCSNHQTRFSDSQKLFEWHRSTTMTPILLSEQQCKDRLLSQKISIMDLGSTDIDN